MVFMERVVSFIVEPFSGNHNNQFWKKMKSHITNKLILIAVVEFVFKKVLCTYSRQKAYKIKEYKV